MSHTLISPIAVLNLANKIVGKTESVTIDSGIFKHYWDNDLLDKSKDVFEILVTDGNEIKIKDLLYAFLRMNTQFLEMTNNGLTDRSYFLEAIRYNSDRQLYEIIWGS